MAQTVVTVMEDGAGRLYAKLSRAEANYKGGELLGPLPLDPQQLPPPNTPDNVRTYGLQVRQALAGHNGIQQALQSILQMPGDRGPTLYFEIQGESAEAIRWETLYEENSFVAVDGPCRLGRVASAVAPISSELRTAPPTVRLVAYLSAAGATAKGELKSLLTQVKTARDAGLALEAVIHLGEQALIDALQAEIDAGQRPGVTVKAIPRNSVELEQALKDAPAELLHFYCHGVVTAGVQYLELATITDWNTEKTDANGNPTGSVKLSTDRLVSSPALKKAWITVLNCCSGATAVGDSNSMAYRLVARGGAAAAVGMSEPIDSADAPDISGPFYNAVFEQTRQALDALKQGQPASIDFAAAMAPVRRSLMAKHPEDDTPELWGQWTLPVLYLSGQPLQVTAIDEQTRVKITTIAELLRMLPPSVPKELRAGYLEILEKAGVPPEMRPDAFGVFERT